MGIRFRPIARKKGGSGMIESVMIAVCDECGGAYLQSNGKIKFFPNKETALTTCIYSGWAKVNGKLYCPKCHEYNVKIGKYKPKVKED